MRFVIEVIPADGDRVEGTVQREGTECTPFCGWLELLRLLEPGAGAAAARLAQGAMTAPAPGAHPSGDSNREGIG